MSVRVMAWVWEHALVGHADMLMLLALADHAHDDGASCYPSVNRLAHKTRMTRRGAQLALRRLEAAGIIAADGRGPRGTIAYRIVMGANPSSRAKPSSPPGEAQFAGGSEAEFTGRGEVRLALAANPGSPEPSEEPSGQPSTEPPLPPQPPASGGRRRDRAGFEEEMHAWAAQHFPDQPVSRVEAVADRVRRTGEPPTPEAMREWSRGKAGYDLTDKAAA